MAKKKNTGGRPKKDEADKILARSISATPEQWEAWDAAAATWKNRSQWAAPILDAWASVDSQALLMAAAQSGKPLIEYLRERLES